MKNETTAKTFQAENIELRQRIVRLERLIQRILCQRSKIQRTQRELRSREIQLQTIIEKNVDAIVVNSKGVVCFVNPAAEELFQRSAQELLHRELGIPIVSDEKADVDIIDQYGQRRVAEMRVATIQWNGEQAYLATFREITARKHIEEELERRVEERTAMLQKSTEQLAKELHQREKAEKDLLRRDAILEAIEFAAHRFMKITSVIQEIPSVLEYFGKATLVSRVIFFRVNHDETRALHPQIQTMWVSPTWTIGQEQRKPTNNRNQETVSLSGETRNFSRWKERLQRGFAIFGDVRTFPSDERLILEQHHICSVVVVPIFVENTWWGFIEFDECQPKRVWSLPEVEALKAAASIIGAALQHEYVMEALRASEEQLWSFALENDPIFR